MEKIKVKHQLAIKNHEQSISLLSDDLQDRDKQIPDYQA